MSNLAELLSIIVPTYLQRAVGWDFLEDLASKLKGLSIEGEILIIDDASPYPVALTELPKFDHIEVRIIRSEIRKGPNGARNLGIKAASSNNILLLDSGDLLSQELIKASYTNLVLNGPVKLTGGNYVEKRRVRFREREITFDIKDAKFMGKTCPNGSGMAFRKETWSAVGGFDETIFYGATDREFGLRVIDHFGKDSIEIYPLPIHHVLRTSPIAVFVRAFRLSRGYVLVLNKRKLKDRSIHERATLNLLHFNRKRVISLISQEGLIFTTSSFLGKVIGRLFWKFALVGRRTEL